MCLKELRDEFLYDCECRHLAKGSLRNYRASTRFLLEFLERKQITELENVRPRHLRDLMKEKQDAGNTPRYINDLLKVWRTWFNYLVEEGYLEERDNPAKKVKPLRQPRTIIDTFTAAEMKRMIQFYDGKDFLEVRNKTIIMLLFDTGMRCNEMILMEPEDIKPDYILVKHGKGVRAHTTATPFDVTGLKELPKVGIVYNHAGVEGLQAEALVKAGYKGIVNAGVGNGNIHKSIWPVLEQATKNGAVVVRSSRVPTGATTKDAEVDDKAQHWVSSGELNPQKARVLLQLALTKTSDWKEVQKYFDLY